MAITGREALAELKDNYHAPRDVELFKVIEREFDVVDLIKHNISIRHDFKFITPETSSNPDSDFKRYVVMTEFSAKQIDEEASKVLTQWLIDNVDRTMLERFLSKK